MKVRGATVFEELRRALLDVHADAARIHEDHQRLDARMHDLVSQRGEAILELAQHYLPTISRDVVESSFAEIRNDLRVILERKERQSQELTGRLGRLREAAAHTQAQLQAAAEQATNLVRQRDATQVELTQRLAANPEFQNLSKSTLAAEAELQKDEERVAQIKNEAGEKLPAYERSSLFQYLQKQRFGTPEYASRGIIRRLDRWLARSIDFGRARSSYQFLRATPELMRQETARRRDEFHKQMTRLEEIETQTAKELSAPDRIAAADKARQDQQRIAGSLESDQERVRLAEQELAALDQAQGRFYEEALSRFRGFLSQAETRLLETKASQTPDRLDDEIVTRLRIISDDLAELQPQVSRLTEESQAADKRSAGMEFLVRRFEQANFHEERSFFADGFDVASLIQQFRAGAFDKDAFWEMLKRSQERELTEFEKRASEVAKRAMNGPLAGSLAEAMIQVAGAALSQSVGRSINRRQNFSSNSSAPTDSKPTWVRTNPTHQED